MTLARFPCVACSIGAPAHRDPDRAIAFVLNADYLRYFKVMLASLRAFGSFLECPLVVITDAPKVADDPVVRLVADEIRLLSDTDIRTYENVDGSRIPDSFAYKSIPKFTFLKWQAFLLEGFREVVLIDCDMLSIRNLDGLGFFSEPMGDADLFATPKFPRKLLDLRAEPDTLSAEFRKVLDLDLASAGVNTGILRINGRICNRAFHDALVEYAQDNGRGYEQSFITHFFNESPSHSLRIADASCNVHASHFAHLPFAHQLDLLDQVAIFHFIGDYAKPLGGNDGNRRLLPVALWWSMEREMRKALKAAGM